MADSDPTAVPHVIREARLQFVRDLHERAVRQFARTSDLEAQEQISLALTDLQLADMWLRGSDDPHVTLDVIDFALKLAVARLAAVDEILGTLPPAG